MPLRGEAAHAPTYDLRSTLSAGSAITVKKAWHEIYNRHCAQKTVRLERYNGSLGVSEPEILKELEHPHIVPIWEAQYDPQIDGAVTFVMPWFDGGSVQDALDRGERLSVLQACGIVCDALEALVYVHGVAKLLHRDIKPGNILLDEDHNRGFLTDFGSAGRKSPPPPVGYGTSLAYLDPAAYQANGMTEQSDIYAMGLTLYEMLNGPLNVSDVDPNRFRQQLEAGKRPFPESRLVWLPQIPDRLRRVVRKAMRAEPRSRFLRASEFLAALRAIECIDWRQIPNTQDTRLWEGEWPPQRRRGERRRYRVTAHQLRSGPYAGRYRLEAEYVGLNGQWRKFGVPDEVVDFADDMVLEQFFSTVDVQVVSNRAAR